MRKTLVLASSHHAFMDYISERNLNPNHFSYASSEDAIRGYRGTVIAIGSWSLNKYYNITLGFEYISAMKNAGMISIIQSS